MGGRGQASPGGNAAGKTNNPSGGITIGNDEIAFDGELVYGEKDSEISGVVRATVDAFEAKRKNQKVEYGNTVKADGDDLGEVRGGKNGVSVPFWYIEGPTAKDGAYSHIHPRGEGKLGGTFSVANGSEEADLEIWAGGDVKTFRAAAKEGIYSISKKSNFDKSGFVDYARQANTSARKTEKAANDEAYKGYVDGEYSYEEYLRRCDKHFNNFLIENHNALLAGQKKYGYTYTLERW